MRAVALRLAGPLQAWGAWSIGDDRTTLDTPTKSGVLGLVACCLGLTREQHAALVDLHASCAVHLRADRAGRRLVDDQTIQGLDEVRLADGERRASRTRATIQSKRTYLADASFVALVASDDLPRLESIAGALRGPAFIPFLGRKCCPPAEPLFLAGLPAVLEASDLEALFALVPRGDRPGDSDGPIDLFLEGDHPHPRRLRLLRQRDALTGPLGRQFTERVVSHVRLSTSDPIDDWMPA